MMRRSAAAAMLAALLTTAPAAAASRDCGGEVACRVAAGRYYIAVPPEWTRSDPLAAVVFFHGWRSSGLRVIRREALREAAHATGYALVAPDGVNGSWSHVGSPSQTRDELAFMDQVRADLRRRWHVDPDRLLVSGFSQGGSMAWDLACYRGDAYRAFAPVAGAFWEPLPAGCPAGAQDLRHVHGTDDTVVPMAGRTIREVYRQGDVRNGLALWREAARCPKAPDRTATQGELTCQVWTRCATGREVQLCLHDGGHTMRPAWLASAIRWIEGLKD